MPTTTLTDIQLYTAISLGLTMTAACLIVSVRITRAREWPWHMALLGCCGLTGLAVLAALAYGKSLQRHLAARRAQLVELPEDDDAPLLDPEAPRGRSFDLAS